MSSMNELVAYPAMVFGSDVGFQWYGKLPSAKTADGSGRCIVPYRKNRENLKTKASTTIKCHERLFLLEVFSCKGIGYYML